MIGLASILLFAAQPMVDCENDDTQSAMNFCAAQEYQRADALLNEQWALTVDAVQARDARRSEADAEDLAEGYATLLTAQRAWLIYRDMQCTSARLPYLRGTMGGLVHANCMTELTNNRIAELRELGPQ